MTTATRQEKNSLATKRIHADRHRSRRRQRIAPTAVAIAGLTLLFWSANSSATSIASAPGVTAKSVLIGSDQPLTGEAATGYSEIGPASAAFFDYVNAHGGVNGRKIDYIYLNDAYNPTSQAKAIADEQHLVKVDRVFAYFNGFGVLTHSAIVNALNRERVPDLFVGSSCACWNEPAQRPYTFGFGNNYTLEGRIIGDYVARSFPTEKIAYLYQENPIACCQQAVPQLDQEIPPRQVVSRQGFTTSDLSSPTLFAAKLQAASAADAQVLILDSSLPSRSPKRSSTMPGSAITRS